MRWKTRSGYASHLRVHVIPFIGSARLPQRRDGARPFESAVGWEGRPRGWGERLTRSPWRSLIGDVRAQQLLRRHPVVTVAVAAAAPLVVAAALAALGEALSSATQVLVLVALVVTFSATGIRAAGVAAALSAVAWFDFFLTAPYRSFAINDPNDIEAAVLLLVIGGIVTETARWGQRNEAALGREVGYVDGVLATAESVASDQRTAEEQARSICLRIKEVLDLDACRFEPGATAERFALTLNADGSVTKAGEMVDVERDGLPVDSVVVLPVRSGGEVRGRFLLTSGSHVARPSGRQRRVAVLLADQISSSLNERP